MEHRGISNHGNHENEYIADNRIGLHAKPRHRYMVAEKVIVPRRAGDYRL